MSELEVIPTLLGDLSQGLSPSFNEAHVLMTFELLGEERVGRKQLSEKLGLGEGVVRNILRRFQSNSLIMTSRKGNALSEKGMIILARLKDILASVIIPETVITVGSCNFAVRVRNVSDLITSGLEQRDHALLAGAKGATTLVYRNNQFSFPYSEIGIESDIEEFLTEHLSLENGDVVIVGTADSVLRAEIGAKTAAMKLIT
jgi:predicted transcriptional regulator